MNPTLEQTNVPYFNLYARDFGDLLRRNVITESDRSLSEGAAPVCRVHVFASE